MLNGLIGAVIATVIWYVIGVHRINTACTKGYEAYIKNVRDGKLVVTQYQTIEDVFYVLLKLIKDKRLHDSFADFLGEEK